MSILEDVTTMADAAANPDLPRAAVKVEGFNGTTWDRKRNNHEVTAFASVYRVTTTNGSDVTNYDAKGARFTLDITLAAGTTPTLVVKLQGKDSLSGQYVDISGAAFASKNSTGTDELVVYPGVAETANESVSDILPRVWRAVATIGGTSPSFTFSLGASYVN